jgi:magnesium transporter
MKPSSPARSTPSRAAQVSRDLSLKELSTCVREGKGPLWVDIDTSVRQQLALLEKVFAFHPLAIEDVLSPSSRAKVESYDGYLFVVLAPYDSTRKRRIRTTSRRKTSTSSYPTSSW